MISIFICAHNPDRGYLRRVLDSCFNQDGIGESEVLLVDSGSNPSLSVPNGFEGRLKIIREDLPGLGLARARGIRACSGETLVFVDDDTVLAPDYCATAVRLLKQHPFLGAVGGQLIPEFQGELELEEKYYWERLAIRKFTGAHWSNRWDDFSTSPIGGGMVVRDALARTWAEKFFDTPWRNRLGRNGVSMAGAEDVDLLHTVCELGYGKGVFDSLVLTHLIPQSRLKPEFLVRIARGNAMSWAYLRGMLFPNISPPPHTLAHRIKIFAEAHRKRRLDRDLVLAENRGMWEGWDAVAKARVEESE